MTTEGVTRKRRIRAGHKASATRMLTQINALLADESPDLSKLSQLKLSLQEKLETIKLLDGEMLGLVDEGDLTSEIEQADDFKEGIYTAVIKIDKTVNRASLPTPDRPAETPTTVPSRSSDRVKLPKLVLRTFNGDITMWASFWESYESAVHSSRELSDIDKFNYLNSLLIGTAREAVAGLSLTAANYQDAIAILKKHFGNVQQRKAKHMEILMNIESVTSSRDLKGLRKLHDSVESHVRSLTAIGVNPTSYGSLLVPVLLNKLPPELQLIASRKVAEEDWNLAPLLKIIEEEIAARERVQTKPSQVAQPQGQRKNAEQNFPTATTLVSNMAPSALMCCFCQQPHPPAKCATVTQIEARKQILKRSGRCFRCLRKGHIGRECRSSIKCSHCNGRHHASVCPREPLQQSSSNGSSQGNSIPTATTAALNVGQSNNTVTSQTNKTSLNPNATTFTNLTPTTAVLHVGVSKLVFLQTAQTEVSNPMNPQLVAKVRVILDNGSQRSYITYRVKEMIDLMPENTQCLSIATFGVDKTENRICEAVTLVMKMKHGLDQKIVAFVVPHICEPIAPQPLNVCIKDCEHLSQLEFADSYDDSPLKIDILIGSDYYWDLMMGEIQRGNTGPVAINTRLGWVLSGPGSPPLADLSTTSLITVHTLTVGTESFNDHNLTNQLRSFWELESLGIGKVEKSTHDKFKEDICFKEGRYEVSLPWKEIHKPLSDNYTLSLWRLWGLINRLRETPEVLREYDATIQDQINKGIIEVVPNSEISLGKVHYLPHHAVIRRDKETTKLRVVYDASSSRSGGPSLNDCLYTGPKFNQNVFDILLRFRSYRVALTADIEKAFLMISINPRDRDALRFLWVNDVQHGEPNVITLRFTRVVFGVSSSPFLLNATIRHHLERYSASHPKLVSCILQSLYVDDLVSGAKDEESAYKLFVTSKQILKSGSFNLRKFATNSPSLQVVIDNLENSKIGKPEKSFCNDVDETFAKSTINQSHPNDSGGQKILGVHWDVVSDQFSFSFKGLAAVAAKIEPPKRSVVSLVSRFYDPLGLITPVTIRFKVFIQTLCETTATWDQPLDGKLLHQWQRLVSELQDGKPIAIPRYYCHGITEECTSYELYGFCDASNSAYAAVVYLVIKTSTGRFVRFVTSKHRLKQFLGWNYSLRSY